MFKILLIFCFLPQFALAFSAPVQIIKLKKGKAIIKIPKSLKLNKGGIYYLTTESRRKKIHRNTSAGREYFLTSGLSFLSSSTIASLSKTSLSAFEVNLSAGKNYESFEIGLTAGFQSISQESTTSSAESQQWRVGLLLDYNFAENYMGVDSVLAIRFKVNYGSEDNSAQSDGYSVIRGQGGLVYKWFFPHSDFALTPEVSYRYEALSNNSTRSGIVVGIQYQQYFSSINY